MADDVGPFRTQAKLARALATIDELTTTLGDRPAGDGGPFDMRRIDWRLDSATCCWSRESSPQAALAAHREQWQRDQREDFPGMLPERQVN